MKAAGQDPVEDSEVPELRPAGWALTQRSVDDKAPGQAGAEAAGDGAAGVSGPQATPGSPLSAGGRPRRGSGGGRLPGVTSVLCVSLQVVFQKYLLSKKIMVLECMGEWLSICLLLGQKSFRLRTGTFRWRLPQGERFRSPAGLEPLQVTWRALVHLRPITCTSGSRTLWSRGLFQPEEAGTLVQVLWVAVSR